MIELNLGGALIGVHSAAFIDSLAKDRDWKLRVGSFQFQLEATDGILEEINAEAFEFTAGEGSVHAFAAGFPAAAQASGQWMYELVLETAPTVNFHQGVTREWSSDSHDEYSVYPEDSEDEDEPKKEYAGKAGGTAYTEYSHDWSEFSVGWQADRGSGMFGGYSVGGEPIADQVYTLDHFRDNIAGMMLGRSPTSVALGADGKLRHNNLLCGLAIPQTVFKTHYGPLQVDHIPTVVMSPNTNRIVMTRGVSKHEECTNHRNDYRYRPKKRTGLKPKPLEGTQSANDGVRLWCHKSILTQQLQPGDVVGVAVNLDLSRIAFGVNGRWVEVLPSTSSALLSPEMQGRFVYPAVSGVACGARAHFNLQGPFKYPPPQTLGFVPRPLLAAPTSPKKKTTALLLAYGSFNPVHTQHIEMMRQAKAFLENRAEQPLIVAGGQFVVASDMHVQTKQPDIALPFELRQHLSRLAAGEDDWLHVANFRADNVPANHSEYFARFAKELGLNIAPCDCFLVVGGDHPWRSSNGQPKWRDVRSSRRENVLLVSRGDAESSAMIGAWKRDLESKQVHPLTKYIAIEHRVGTESAVTNGLADSGYLPMQPTSSTAIRATISGNANPIAAVEAWVESGGLSSRVASGLLAALLSPTIGGGAPQLARPSGVAWDQHDQNTAEHTFNFGHPTFDAVLAMPAAAATAAATAQWINSAGAYIVRRKSETDKWELLVQDPDNSDRCRLIGGYRKPESLACKILAMRSECWHEANVVFTKKLLRQATAPGFFTRPDGMLGTERTNGGVVMVQVFELDYAESCNGELQSRESGAELGWVEMASVALRDPIEQECLAWVRKTMLPKLGVDLIPPSTTFHTNIVADVDDQLRLVTNAVALESIQALEANAAELVTLLKLSQAPVEQLPLVRYEDYKSLDGSITAERIDELTL